MMGPQIHSQLPMGTIPFDRCAILPSQEDPRLWSDRNASGSTEVKRVLDLRHQSNRIAQQLAGFNIQKIRWQIHQKSRWLKKRSHVTTGTWNHWSKKITDPDDESTKLLTYVPLGLNNLKSPRIWSFLRENSDGFPTSKLVRQSVRAKLPNAEHTCSILLTPKVGHFENLFGWRRHIRGIQHQTLQRTKTNWLVVWTPLKHISQLGLQHSQYMESHKTCSKPPTSKSSSVWLAKHAFFPFAPNGTRIDVSLARRWLTTGYSMASMVVLAENGSHRSPRVEVKLLEMVAGNLPIGSMVLVYMLTWLGYICM